MNKKLFSAALFGALLLGTASTFVSCKDYDDDIAGLQTQINDVKAAVSALEAKVNAGKFVTGINSTADGITISLSDGSSYTVTNGKNGVNGTNGVDGAAGTEWTISEDGFWVCNGEKTDVLAVGQKGENGQDAQPEVKKENGKWYLWNGEEFEEFTSPEAPAAANVPYVMADPNDPNYMILVAYTEDGVKTIIRLPMNSGLAQINIVKGANMQINFFRLAKDVEWIGDKEVPAKGEYMVTQPETSYLIQVTPANYDLSALDLKVVNAKGDVAPLVLGAPTPYIDFITKAVSESGIYEVTVAPKDFSAETIKDWKENFQGEPLSLVANESVRSTYGARLFMTNMASTTIPTLDALPWGVSANLTETNTIKFEAWDVTSSGGGYSVNWVDQSWVYDTKIVMADDNAKADSIKCNVKTNGNTISADKDCSLNVKVYFLDAKGKTHVSATTADFYTVTPVEATTFNLPAVKHQATDEAADQNVLVSLDTYFKEYVATAAERLVWNVDASMSAGATIEIDGNTTYARATWEHENSYGDTVTDRITDLVASISFVDEDGAAAGKADATHLKVTFNSNYGSTIDFEEGKLTVYATVYMPDESGTYQPAQVLAIPVTIAAPADETIAELVADEFDPAYFANGVLTVLNATSATLPTVFDYSKAKAAKGVTLSGGNTVSITKADGKEYAISKVGVTYLGRKFYTTIKVKFVDTTDTDYTLAVGKDLAVVCAGANSISVKANAIVKADGTTYFTDVVVKNFAGVVQNITNLKMTEVEWDDTAEDYADVASADRKLAITNGTTKVGIKSVGDRIANDITVTVKIEATVALSDGTTKTVEDYATVTIKANM